MASTRLSEADKQAAIDRYRQPGETTATVASEFGVSVSTVSRLLKNELTVSEYDQLIRQKRQATKDALGLLDGAEDDEDEAENAEAEAPALDVSRSKPVLKAARLKLAPEPELIFEPEPEPEPEPVPEPAPIVEPVRSAPVARVMEAIDPAAAAAADSAAAASDRRSRRRSSASRSSQLELLSAQMIADPQPESGFEPAAATRVVMTPVVPIVPKAEPIVVPRVEPRIEPRIEPRLEPRVEPKIEARVEPKIEARVEPKIEPRIEPRIESRIEPEPRYEPRSDSFEAPIVKSARPVIKSRSISPEVVDEPPPAALAGAGDYNLDDDFEDDEEFEEDEDGEDEAPLMARSGERVRVLPLSEAHLPRMFYIVIDRMAELVTCPLQEFRDLGELPPEEESQETLPVFDNHRIAQRFSRRNPKKNQRVIKLPDGRVLAKTSHWLRAKGIQRLLLDGQVYALDR
jgi:transposase-like protein